MRPSTQSPRNPVRVHLGPLQGPIVTPSLHELLGQWVDASPPGEVNCRRELQSRVLEWQRTNQGLAHDHTSCLDLSELQLVELPAALGMLDNLVTLDLFGNQLTGLPPEMEHLQNLRSLCLGCNQLTQLPQVVGRLVNLECLDLENNQLTQLPPEIGRLVNLKSLDVDHNRLTQLPPEIGQLAALQTFTLTGNQLPQLPPAIGGMADLQQLYLSNNGLTELAPEIGRLAKLEDLYLVGNELTRLPSEIGNLRSLRNLYLGGNQLTRLPAEIGHLANLRDISLGRNQLTQLPPEIGQLTNLLSLCLEHNELQQLPFEIGQLANLQDLNLGYNPLMQLPPEIGQLVNLQFLYLDRTRVWQVPPEIRQLPNLDVSRCSDAHTDADAEVDTDADTEVEDAVAPAATGPAFLISHEERRDLWNGEIDAPAFWGWLDQMRQTRDYGNPATRPGLERQLGQLLDAMRGDLEVRKTCIALAAGATETCGDRVALALNDMHEAVLTVQMLRPGVDEDTFIGYAFDMFALKLVNNCARSKIAQLEHVANTRGDEWREDIETMLFFQTELRKRLAPWGINVPVLTQGMLYARCAGVTEADVDAAVISIRRQCGQSATFTAFLAEWPPLLQHLEIRHAQLFSEIHLRCNQAMEELEDKNELHALTDGEYTSVANALMHSRETLLAQLRTRLVSQALERHLQLVPEIQARRVEIFAAFMAQDPRSRSHSRSPRRDSSESRSRSRSRSRDRSSVSSRSASAPIRNLFRTAHTG